MGSIGTPPVWTGRKPEACLAALTLTVASCWLKVLQSQKRRFGMGSGNLRLPPGDFCVVPPGLPPPTHRILLLRFLFPPGSDRDTRTRRARRRLIRNCLFVYEASRKLYLNSGRINTLGPGWTACLRSRDSSGNQAVFGLLGFLAAAGYSINKQRRTEVWVAGVCLLQRPLRALDRRLSCTIMSPHLEGLPVPHKG